jgi:hypothetical protein
MSMLRVPAIIAGVLFMSSFSADAMEFADRPGMTSGLSAPLAIRAMSMSDCLRRQIDGPVILLPVQAAARKLSDRPRPVSLVPIRLSATMLRDRPGRMSAEFSAISIGSDVGREDRAAVQSSHLRLIPAPTAMTFENRPGPISNRFKTLAAASIEYADRRGFTSSLARTDTPPGIQAQTGSLEFCLGSIAPCGPVSFAPRPEMGILSAAYRNGRL